MESVAQGPGFWGVILPSRTVNSFGAPPDVLYALGEYYERIILASRNEEMLRTEIIPRLHDHATLVEAIASPVSPFDSIPYLMSKALFYVMTGKGR
jgi:hypothetical protein